MSVPVAERLLTRLVVDPKKPVRKRASLRKRLAALGVGLVFALVAAEITLRVSGVATLHLNPLSGFHNSDERLGWVGAPSYTGRFRQPEFDVRIEHDEEGFRRPAEAFRGAADAPQVVFLGDSFTWGWGVASGATFVDRVQAAVGDATHVRNRGVNGYGTTQHLVLLRERVLELRPRAVTLMFCENDVTDCVDVKKGRRPWAELDGGEVVLRNLPVEQRMVGWWPQLRRKSKALSLLTYQFDVLSAKWKQMMKGKPVYAADDEAVTMSPWREPRPSWDVCAALLGEIAQLCAEQQPPVEMRLVYIPVLSDAVGPEPDPASPGRLQNRLAATCAAHGIRYLDLTPAFRSVIEAHQRDGGDAPGEPLFFPGDGHWSEEGHALAAEQLLQAFAWRF